MKQVSMVRSGFLTVASLLVGLFVFSGLLSGCNSSAGGSTKMTQKEKEQFTKPPTSDQMAEMQKMRTANEGKTAAAAAAAAESAKSSKP